MVTFAALLAPDAHIKYIATAKKGDSRKVKSANPKVS